MKTASKPKSLGMSKHPLYATWRSMVSRCHNPKNPHYKNYGALGVTVCSEWKNSIKEFVDWAENNGYKKGLFLDKDVKSTGVKTYSPDTCKFVTRTVNNKVTRIIRSTNTSGYRGVHFDKNTSLWVAGIRIKSKTKYLGSYKTALEAAKVYDYFIIKNEFSNTANGVLEKDEVAEPVFPAIRKDSSSGFTGVSKLKSKKEKWRAYVNLNKKHIAIGTFDAAEEAFAAREDYLKSKRLQEA